MANYYDIDDILTDEEFVPVVFHKAANEVIIDPSSETNSVEQGAKVKLPLWLSQELHWRQAVSISVLPCFNQKTRLEIQADAACVDLRSRCPYFYQFGCKILPLYKEVLTKAYTAAYMATSKILTLLTREETTCMRLLSLPCQPLRNGGWVAPDCKEL